MVPNYFIGKCIKSGIGLIYWYPTLTVEVLSGHYNTYQGKKDKQTRQKINKLIHNKIEQQRALRAQQKIEI